jgi:uncharacterized RDD family membrane protein YckC
LQRPAPVVLAPPTIAPPDAPPADVPLMDLPLSPPRPVEPAHEPQVLEPRPSSRPILHVEEPTSQVPPIAAAGRVVAAGALPRLGAFLVDLVIVSLGQALLALPALIYWTRGASPGGDAPTFLPIFLSVTLAALAAILTAVYHVYFWGVKAATPGKRLFGLEVQGQDGRLPIGPGRAALRLLGYVVSGLVFGIGFLMIAFGGGGLHDQIAGTRVVRRKGD